MGLNDDIYQKIYNWVYYVINTENGFKIPIVQSRQNTPAPEGTYIVIDRIVEMIQIGRAIKKYPPDETTGKTKISNDYEGTLEIWEIDGEGNFLRILINSLERQEIQNEYFTKELIVNRGVIGITNIPRLDNEYWTEQAMFEMRIGFADTTTEQSSWIDTVDFVDNISH